MHSLVYVGFIFELFLYVDIVSMCELHLHSCYTRWAPVKGNHGMSYLDQH